MVNKGLTFFLALMWMTSAFASCPEVDALFQEVVLKRYSEVAVVKKHTELANLYVRPMEAAASKLGRSTIPMPNSPAKFTTTKEFESLVESELKKFRDQLGRKMSSGDEFFLVVNPESKTISGLSEHLSDRELGDVTSFLQKESKTFSLLAEQPPTKINKHLKVRINEKRELEVTSQRFDESPILFKEVEDRTFEPWSITNKSNDKVMAIPATSKASRKYLTKAHEQGLMDWDMLNAYEPQAYRTFCGLASICNVVRRDKKLVISQEELLKATFQIKRPSIVIGIEGKDPGYNIQSLAKVVSTQKRKAAIVIADKNVEQGTNDFREKLKKALKERSGVIVNFDGRALGGRTGGHFSPIAGLDPVNDKVLVLDVAQHKNEAFWVSTEDLYKAMNTTDSEGNLRGYMVISTP